MIRFENTTVTNFEGAIRGMRNSFASWHLSDSEVINGKFHMGEKDHRLAMNLSKAGASHGKYLRQIFVSVDIIAPDYMWKQIDTYKVATVANSTSTMHTLGKESIDLSEFSFEDVDEDLKEQVSQLLNEVHKRWIHSGKKKPSREWRQMIQLLPMGFNFRRTWTANYQVLKTMYHDRKNHPLAEWQDFCRWVEMLPYAELITDGTKSEKKYIR